MSLEKGKNESYSDYKWRMLLDKRKEESEHTWEEIHEALNLGLGIDSIKKGTIFLPEFEEYMIQKFNSNEDKVKYKESLELKGDGTRTSDKLISIANAQDITEEFLLTAHGFNVDEFELVSAKNSIWNVSAGKDPDKTLYSSKISVKTKVNGFNIDKFVNSIENKVNPLYTKVDNKLSDSMLEIPLTDLHMGINTKEEYQPYIDEIIELVKSKRWDSIYIPFGSDLLHHDTFDGKTSNSTQIEVVDIQKAWTEAFLIYEELFTVALENSNEVTGHYVCGNHDKVMSYGLARALQVRFPQVTWDNDIYNKKLFTWKDVAILFTHGDKANRINKTAIREYGKVIADKAIFEIHMGHLHFSQSKDDFGVVVRTLPTRAKSDLWHSENNFLGANKVFQLFEYKKDMLKTIHYI